MASGKTECASVDGSWKLFVEFAIQSGGAVEQKMRIVPNMTYIQGVNVTHALSTMHAMKSWLSCVHVPAGVTIGLECTCALGQTIEAAAVIAEPRRDVMCVLWAGPTFRLVRRAGKAYNSSKYVYHVVLTPLHFAEDDASRYSAGAAWNDWLARYEQWSAAFARRNVRHHTSRSVRCVQCVLRTIEHWGSWGMGAVGAAVRAGTIVGQ